ncbi:hypothetical protein [Nonomuraea sp. NPDC050643]
MPSSSTHRLYQAAIALLGVMSIALFHALVLAERVLLPWVWESAAVR